MGPLQRRIARHNSLETPAEPGRCSMAKMDILMRTEQVRKDIVISISSFTQTVEQFKDKLVHCLPVKSMCLIERRFKEHSLPIVCYI